YTTMKKVLLTGIACFALSLLTDAQVPSYVPTSGLIGWWPFTGNANDQSGHALNGVVTAATLTSDRNGTANSAYYFNGVNGTKIQVADNILLHPASFTVSAWEYVTDPTIWNQVLSKRIAATSTNSYILYEASKTNCTTCNLPYQPFEIAATIGGSQKKTYLTYPNLDSVMNNTWNMVTGSYDGSTLKFYLNGQLIRSLATSGAISYTTDPLYFGATGSNGQNFKGNIDDIGIWNRALSASEIMALYTALTTVPDLNAVESTPELSVFPNPASYQITIKADYQLLGKVFRIYDRTGNVVANGKLNSETTQIKLEALPAGAYSIQLEDKTSQTFTVVK
ncbi:MAG: LamG-like jellyroll fold domain-containing protein, partial [Flavobacterium sp.]